LECGFIVVFRKTASSDCPSEVVFATDGRIDINFYFLLKIDINFDTKFQEYQLLIAFVINFEHTFFSCARFLPPRRPAPK
jgi:hypothetical protein